MRFLLSNKVLKHKDVDFTTEFVLRKIDSLNLIIDRIDHLNTFEDIWCINQGYLRDCSSNDLRSNYQTLINYIANSWPLHDSATGSFSSVICNPEKTEVVICNDPIGVYPLYYLKTEDGFYISNSIILIGNFTNIEFDETGIIERTTLPEYSELGTRTILKNCKRILPGEWIRFNFEGKRLESKYDNTLFNLELHDNLDKLVDDYWSVFKQELSCLLKNESEITVALSGGMDSRILLGGLPENRNINCVSYGPDNSYEIGIAEKLARLRKASFKSYSNSHLNFPNLNVLEKYVRNTEAVYLCSWLEILENIEVEPERIFLLGDLSTALTGRSIKRFSSKAYQKKHFLKHSFLSKDYELEENNNENFVKWKDETLKYYLSFYTPKTIKARELGISRERLVKNIENDLNELFERIDSHNLKYLEQVEELFTWYTHTRIPMGKQILINNYRYKSYCPGLSLRVLRYSSSIHPNHRLNNRFIDRLNKRIPILRKLGRIPTSQIPLVPQNTNNIIRFPIWALRSKIDSILIKRIVKSKDPSRRYRLFSSNNWVKIYQNPELEKKLSEYFQSGHLGDEFMDQIKKRGLERRDLKQWPFANMDIINAVALNIEIDHIKNKKYK